MNDPRAAAETLIRTWYEKFNQGDRAAMLALLTDDVIHDVNQGAREIGLEACAKFLDRMDTSYVEHLSELVVMADATGTRAAAEFVVQGKYVATDAGLPMAKGQDYALPAGAFLLRMRRLTSGLICSGLYSMFLLAIPWVVVAVLREYNSGLLAPYFVYVWISSLMLAFAVTLVMVGVCARAKGYRLRTSRRAA